MTNILRPSAGTLNSGAWSTLSFTASLFNSLASGSGVLMNAAFSNASNLDLYGEFSFTCVNGSTALAGSPYWTVYWLPINQDGTTYGDGLAYGSGTAQSSTVPSSGYYLRNITLGLTGAGGTMVGRSAPFNLPRDSGKFFFVNNTGQTTNSAAAFSAAILTTNLNLNG